MADEPIELLTIKETAWKLGISERTVRRLIDSKALTACSITGNGGCIRIFGESLDTHLETMRIRALARE